MHSFFSTQSLLKHYQNPLKIRLLKHEIALKNSGFMVSSTHQKALYFKGSTLANSPKDDTDLSAIPLKKLDAILNQIQKQNSQINELSAENEKLRSELKKREELLARANAENKRRNEIVEGFKSMLFKVGQTSEAGIVSKFLQSTKQEEIQEQPSIQTSIFGEDNAIFNEIEIMAPHANTEKELDIPEDKKQTTNKTKFKKKKLSLISEDLLSLNLPLETLYLDDI